MNTRIKKFSALRNKVEQEIKILKMRDQNLEKIKKYKAKINKIDSKIFSENSKISEDVFPDLSSLIYVERENTRANLKQNLEEINKWKKNVRNEIEKDKFKEEKIDSVVPEFENENLIKQQIKIAKAEEEKFNKSFQEMKKKKNEILEKAKKNNEKEFEKNKIFNEIKENNNNIENKLRNIIFWIKTKKQKTIWIFWISLLIIIGLIICLFLIVIFSQTK